jgi:hypothetical protein
MTIADLIISIRGLLDDEVVPYKWSDAEIIRYINDAQMEACRRASLIIAYPSVVSITGVNNITFDDTTKTITKASGGFLLSSGGESEVNSFEKDDTITVTGTVSNNSTLTISSVTDTVITVLETVVDESDKSAVITAIRNVTRIPLVSTKHTYKLHPKIVQVLRARPDSLEYPLKQRTLPGLDAGIVTTHNALGGFYTSTWETLEDNMAYFIQDSGLLRLVSPPSGNDILWIVTSRLPKYEFQPTGDTTKSPEIPIIYHADLIDWVLYLAFKKPDSEVQDLNRAKEYESSFDKKFGLRPSAQTEMSRKRLPNNMGMRHRPLGF